MLLYIRVTFKIKDQDFQLVAKSSIHYYYTIYYAKLKLLHVNLEQKINVNVIKTAQRRNNFQKELISRKSVQNSQNFGSCI